MELHIEYEKQPEFPLEQIESPTAEVSFRVDRMKLSKDKSELRYNDFLLLRGIPAATYDYRLGNRSALEWVRSSEIQTSTTSAARRAAIHRPPLRHRQRPQPPRRPQIHPPPRRPGHHRLARNPADHRRPPLPQLPCLAEGARFHPGFAHAPVDTARIINKWSRLRLSRAKAQSSLNLPPISPMNRRLEGKPCAVNTLAIFPLL